MLESILLAVFLVFFVLICWWSLWDQDRQLRKDTEQQKRLYASYR